MSTFSIDLEDFGGTPLFYSHCSKTWPNVVHVNIISGDGMSVQVITYGYKKSITILTAGIRPMIKFNIAQARDWFHQEVMWPLQICLQLSTYFVLDLDRIHHCPHALLLQSDTYGLPKGNQ